MLSPRPPYPVAVSGHHARHTRSVHPGLTPTRASVGRRAGSLPRVHSILSNGSLHGGFHIEGRSNDTTELRAHQVQFISAVTDGPVEYSGDGMRKVHSGMGITDTEFEVVAEHLDTALAAHGVADDDRDAVLETVEELRSEIVEIPEPAETGSATS